MSKRTELPGTKIYRLKTMVELLADGWAVLPVPGSHHKKKLCKPHMLAIPEDYWIYLGHQLPMTYDPAKGFVDVSLFRWSKAAIVRATPTRQATTSVAPCSCDIKQLFSVGCQCGGFKREQSARQA